MKIRPALAGVEPPGTGPPPDVIRTYVLPGLAVKATRANSLEEGDEAAGESEGEAEPNAATADAATPDEGDAR